MCTLCDIQLRLRGNNNNNKKMLKYFCITKGYVHFKVFFVIVIFTLPLWIYSEKSERRKESMKEKNNKGQSCQASVVWPGHCSLLTRMWMQGKGLQDPLRDIHFWLDSGDYRAKHTPLLHDRKDLIEFCIWNLLTLKRSIRRLFILDAHNLPWEMF